MIHARDIPDESVLELVAACNEGRCEGGEGWHGGAPGYGENLSWEKDQSISPHPLSRWDLARALGVPEKVALAKARRLIRRGKMKGCYCGCRGDFEI